MLSDNLDSDTDAAPHTLCSHLPIDGIPIPRPSHHGSLSIGSNLLQISQSPTTCFFSQRGQDRRSGPQAPSVNVEVRKEVSLCVSAPSDASDPSHSINHSGSATNFSDETKSPGKETTVPEEEHEEEEQRRQSTEDVSIPPPPAPVVSHEPSVGAWFPPHSNPSCPPAPELVAPSVPPPRSGLSSSLKFFSFVILHVPEDREEAQRVCEILHSLEIGEGTTFCEGFETAGVSPLRCLEDAVENSAYIVLLLTPGFLSRWGEFQTNTVLMNSIDDRDKSGSVIPFTPKYKAPVGRIPLAVRSLIPLNEASDLFPAQVRNTFKRETIQRQRERWRREQDLKAFERSVEDARDLAGDLEIQHRIAMDHQAVCADLYARFSSLMSVLPPPLISGLGPVNIQISNARNVQIGNQNRMDVQHPPETSAGHEQDPAGDSTPRF